MPSPRFFRPHCLDLRARAVPALDPTICKNEKLFNFKCVLKRLYEKLYNGTTRRPPARLRQQPHVTTADGFGRIISIGNFKF